MQQFSQKRSLRLDSWEFQPSDVYNKLSDEERRDAFFNLNNETIWIQTAVPIEVGEDDSESLILTGLKRFDTTEPLNLPNNAHVYGIQIRVDAKRCATLLHSFFSL